MRKNLTELCHRHMRLLLCFNQYVLVGLWIF